MMDANYFCKFQVISEKTVHTSFFVEGYRHIWARLYMYIYLYFQCASLLDGVVWAGLMGAGGTFD